jgi:serine/threonine protein kinase
MVHEHGHFNENVIKSFTAQIIDGLEYLHSKNVTHGVSSYLCILYSAIAYSVQDLKTKNVLIGSTGICKLANYASFKDIDEYHKPVFTTNMPGSVYWMAPEVVKASKEQLTSKIDIWSLGCVVLEMWSGFRPWPSEDSMSIMLKVSLQRNATELLCLPE